MFHGHRIVGTDRIAAQVTHLLGTGHQHVLAMDADHCDEYRQQWRHHQAAILECIAHCEEPWSDVALEQMHYGLQIAAR